MESGIFEAFTIIKLLRKFYAIDLSVNTSYETVISKRLGQLKHLLPFDFVTSADSVEEPKKAPHNQQRRLRQSNDSRTSLSGASQQSNTKFKTLGIKLSNLEQLRPYTVALTQESGLLSDNQRRALQMKSKIIPQTYFNTIE